MLSSIRKVLCNFLKCYDINISPFEYTRTYDASEILTLLRSEFNTGRIYLSDTVYKTVPKETLRKFLSKDSTNSFLYTPEFYDCDDFSYRLMGQLSTPGYGALPFGIIWVMTSRGGHALNVFVDDQEEIWLIEPQNDKIFKMPKDWKAYIIMM